MGEFMHIAHVRVPGVAQRAMLREQNPALDAVASPEDKPNQPHLASVPADVRTFLKTFARNVINRDLTAMQNQHPDRFFAYGHSKEQTIAMLHNVYRNRPIRRFEFVLTAFHQEGNRARIDGYVQRDGFRTPVMINDIVKESDGRWRWYGNQE